MSSCSPYRRACRTRARSTAADRCLRLAFGVPSGRRYNLGLGHNDVKGVRVIQVCRPVREIEELLSNDEVSSSVTDVRLADGRIHYNILRNGDPYSFSEEPSSAFVALRVIGATLTSIELKDGNVYYTLAEVEQAYTPGGFLERDWWIRDGIARTLTGVHLAGDGLDYEVLDGGQPAVVHQPEESVLGALRILGVRIVGVEFKGGFVHYSLAEST